jgi:hypothetical protein
VTSVTDRERRSDPQQHDGRCEEHEGADERTDDGARRDVVQSADGQVEKRLRSEGNDRKEGAARHDDGSEDVRIGVPVGDPAAQPVAERKRRQDEPDHVRPDDGRGAEVRSKQP